MPNRIPTAGIKTPAVRKSPTAQPAKKPVENMGSLQAKQSAALDKLMKSRFDGKGGYNQGKGN